MLYLKITILNDEQEAGLDGHSNSIEFDKESGPGIMEQVSY